MTLGELRALLSDRNVAAFLRVIRARESSQDESAYTIMNGGAHFTGWSDHPFKGQRTPPAKASGAYQFIASTWAEVAKKYGLTDFSPVSQDLGAVGRIIYRGALDDVRAGRFADAVRKCRLEWTSLPGAAESSSSWTMERALAVFLQYGGKLAAQPAAPIEDKGTELQPEGEDMGALGAGLIGQLLQTVVGAFAPAVRQRVEQATEKVTDPDSAKVLADGLMGVLQQITGTKDPIQATAAVTAPTMDGKAALAKAETAFAAKLDELAPYLVQIADLEARGWKQTEDSRAAARQFNSPEGWKLRMQQVTFTQRMLAYASIVIAVLIALMSVTLIWIPANASAAILNLIGQLVVVLVTTLGLLGSTFRDQNGYSFGGTVDSNAAAIGRTEIVDRRKQGTTT